MKRPLHPKGNHLLSKAIIISLVLASAYAANLKGISMAEAQITPTFSDDQSVEDGENLTIPGKIPGLQEQVSIDVYPESPKPNDEVTITAQTFGVDTNTNTYTWIVNGKEESKGKGKNKFTFRVGATGTVTKVSLYVDPVNGPRITKDFSYTPIDVDILWQASTYTPPFYKGKSLYTPESEVTFMALPNIITQGNRVSPSDVVYRWMIDYKLQNDESGFGKNSLAYKGPIILKESLIQAEVYSASDPTIKGVNGYTLNHVSPQVLIYEDHPLLGTLFNRNISGEYYLNEQEVKFATFPLFFSTKSKNEAVTYKWNLNDGTIDIPNYQNSAVFRRNDSEAGASFMGMTVGNPTHILQKAVAGIAVIYEDARTSSQVPFGSN